MVLSDKSIRDEIESGRIGIDPFSTGDVQPASVDLHLDDKVLVFRNSTAPYVDLRHDIPELNEMVVIEDDEPFILHPGEFVLGNTLERITLSDSIVARLEGKSSLGRIGLLIHSPPDSSTPVGTDISRSNCRTYHDCRSPCTGECR